MREVNYESQFIEAFRPALKPLDIVQPEGPSFVIDGELFWGQDRLGFLDRALARRAARAPE